MSKQFKSINLDGLNFYLFFRRCKNGETAVHAACLSGQTKLLDLLIQYGGDLRLHDNEGRLPKTWAMFQTNKNLKLKMISYIEEARHKVLSTQTAKMINRYVLQQKKKIVREDTFNKKKNFFFFSGPTTSNLYVASKPANFQTPCSVGFGSLYKTINDLGVPIVVPVISESELEHDNLGLTINNGAFMVYEGFV
jgi:hypothetical protein